MLQLASDVNEGIDYKGVHFKMTADIDLASVCGESLGDWPCIGSIDNYFEGLLDGGGNAIRNLYIQSHGTTYRGLFGYIGPYGKVTRLSVDGMVYSSFWAGIIAGASSGEIIDCVNAGGKVEAYQYAGGIVGGNFGTVSRCQNKAPISSSLATGGICGYNYGGVYYCDNIGDIYGYNAAGGLVGYNGGFSSFTNCYNSPMGIVQNCGNMAYVSGKQKIGGAVGRNDGILFNSYNIGDLTANSEAGGLVGFNGGFDGVDGLIYNSYNRGNIACSVTQAGGLAGVNNSVGDMFNLYNSGEVHVPGVGGSVVAQNEGNVSHCYLLGQSRDFAGNNNGFLSDNKCFTKDSVLSLADQLNQWVEQSGDSSFSHWLCPSEGFPIFADASLPFHNVTVYNFHGVLKEDWLLFAEGQQVRLSVLPDEGYSLKKATAVCGEDSIEVALEENRISFVMPHGDVLLYLHWQHSMYLSNEVLARANETVICGKGELTIKVGQQGSEIEIYTLSGKSLRRFYMCAQECKTIKLPAGVYLVNGVEAVVW